MADLSHTILTLSGQPLATAAEFGTLPAAMLADAIGGLDCEVKALEARLSAAKAALKAKGMDRADGLRFTVTVSNSIRITLDTAAVKAALGQEWCDDHSKLADVTTVRVTVNKAALALAA